MQPFISPLEYTLISIIYLAIVFLYLKSIRWDFKDNERPWGMSSQEHAHRRFVLGFIHGFFITFFMCGLICVGYSYTLYGYQF